MYYSTIWLLGWLFLISACGNTKTKSPQKDDTARQAYIEDVSWIDTTHVQRGDFHQEILSNGKLQPLQKAELSFKLNETITHVYVKNGQHVKRDQPLAALENFSQQLALEQASQILARAKTDMQDALIGYGFADKDSADIPPQIYRAAQTKSGYMQAQSNLKKARYELRLTVLRAPFSGIIANLEARVYNAAENYRPFCILIEDQHFEVRFQILETERQLIRQGAQVVVSPFSMPGKRYQGYITSINPLVDISGMIQISARVNNSDHQLISGMNVSVRISKVVPKQLIIPKTAVVLRQGRPVVFTWINDTALWNYVEPGLENSEQLTIQSGLKARDIVITSGNLNLAHKSPVQIANGQ